MGFDTEIGWTQRTWNGWIGCQKISQGCSHCYMYRLEKRFGNNPMNVHRTSDATFYAPLKWKEPALVFACSMSDFFIKEADKWRDDAWEIIRKTPHLTYQILTKRPERIADHLPDDWGEEGYSNVWLGTSVELDRYKERIKHLAKVPAPVHFISAEPMLGPLNLYDGYYVSEGHWEAYLAQIDWIIVGGESGKGNRLMEVSWARRLRDIALKSGDCQGNRRMAFFFKQWGGTRKCDCHKVYGCKLLDGVDWSEIPSPEGPKVLV